MKREELKARLDELANSIVTDPERLKEFTKQWSNGFRGYSMNNYLLASAQRPDFTLLAGYNTWKKKDRHIKKGEKAIWIIAPMSYKRQPLEVNSLSNERDESVEFIYFRPVPVFDVRQTEGKPVEIGCPGFITSAEVDFETIAKFAPVPVRVQPAAFSNGYTDGEEIVVTEKENKAAMAATLIHEWAHIELNHVGITTHTDTIPRDIKELEAEAVSYIVCSFLGIENKKSALYLGNWSATKDKLTNQGARILKTSEKIIRKMSKG